MVAKTGNTYIFEAVRDSVEIPTANPASSTRDELDKNVTKWSRQRRTAKKGKIVAQNVYAAFSGCRSL